MIDVVQVSQSERQHNDFKRGGQSIKNGSMKLFSIKTNKDGSLSNHELELDDAACKMAVGKALGMVEP